MLGAMLLSRPKPPQAGAEGQPLQGHRSERPLFTKVSGPPLVAASTPGRRAESTALACEIHPLKIQKSQKILHLHNHPKVETPNSTIWGRGCRGEPRAMIIINIFKENHRSSERTLY